MKNDSIHRFFAFIIALLLLFPIAIQATHALENHEHTVCNAKDVKHIHQQDVDCSIYHIQIQQDSIDFSTGFNLFNPLIETYYFDGFKQSEYTLHTSLKSSRAPPYFIS